MGLVDSKKSVFTTIGSYNSFNESSELPNTTDLFPSVNNIKDIGSYMVAVLGVTLGSEAIKGLVGELLGNFIGTIEPKIKAGIKKQLITSNAGKTLPGQFISQGIDIPAKDIDVSGDLKNSPTSDAGDLLYGDNNNSFNHRSYSAIQNEGTFVQSGNVNVRYNSYNDSFTYKPNGSSNLNNKIGDWFSDMVDNTEFINKKQITGKVMDRIFGSATSNTGRSVDSIFNQLKFEASLNKMSNDEDDLSVSEEELGELYNKAQQISSGAIQYDLGCGIMEGSLSLEDMATLVNEINESSDPTEIGNKIDGALTSTFGDGGADNKETVKHGFFERIVQGIKMELMMILIMSPIMRMLMGLSSAFLNGNIPTIGEIVDDLNHFKNFIKCIMKLLLALLYEFIFNLIAVALMALIVPIVKKVIKEKIMAYVNIIKSFISKGG